jgi:enamine deaminase RidA (YjgF/YER057c/UK114 family)
MAKKTAEPSRKTRRQILSAGLAGLGGAAAASVHANGRQASPPDERGWTPKKQVVHRPGQKPPVNPLLSSCIRSGHLLFVAGIGGWYPDRRKEPGDIKVQIQSALTTMREILEHAGSSMANVLKVHMTVADPNKNLQLLNEGYRGFFPDPPPARSFSGTPADQMGREGVLVQVDCVAYVD